MRRGLFAFGIVVALMAVWIVPARAVTDGELDGEGHPHVVLLLMEVDGAPAFRCSGTLLSATVLLTAGHCANGFPDFVFSGMRVFTESDVQNGNNNYPFAGPNAVEAVSWAAHPLYETGPFFLHDVGVVILEEPGVVLDEYGTLPTVDQLDVLKTRRGHQDVTFTAVGYGLQEINPVFVESERVRMVAYPHLIQINGGIVGDFSLLLSNNHSTGGTCFGDSGGPNFLGSDPGANVVAGVTSFGLNGNCAGTGGVFRMDRQNVLDFVGVYFP
ncbi:MAG: trypsin-like serine protease [Anaerolineales bacterium]